MRVWMVSSGLQRKSQWITRSLDRLFEARQGITHWQQKVHALQQVLHAGAVWRATTSLSHPPDTDSG